MRKLVLALPLALLAAVTATPAPAHADDGSTLTVVGTSDVSDSDLVAAVIKPGFEKAFPQYTLNYVPKGTGAAIDYAKAGTASALIVHAASLENQFVEQGYSLEPAGRAVFYGDYVLLGQTADPAKVRAGAPDDVVAAYEAVAAAGARGEANFVSRGGTPGTTVQEHAIWARTTGVTLCTVSAANGGGASPSTTTGDCPSKISYPGWYHATGLTQGPNIVNGDTCNYGGGGCYVFTDRGTYQYLQSQGSVSSLQVVTRATPATPADRSRLLLNYFHAYGVNPAKFDSQTASSINTTAAKAFLGWLTAPAAQAAVGAYLADGGDPPFLPDAAPKATVDPLPALRPAGHALPVTVHLANSAPGLPPLAGQPVRLLQQGVGETAGTVVRTGTTDATGSVSWTLQPTRSARYSVATGQLTQTEVPDLAPPFSDLLEAQVSAPQTTTLYATPGTPALTSGPGTIRLTSRLVPVPSVTRGYVGVWAAVADHPLRLVKAGYVAPGTTTATVVLSSLERSRTWNVQVRYAGAGSVQFVEGRSPVASTRVP